MAVLNAVGQLFIYKMIKEFRQHVPSFVIAFRKCLTVMVNILWFGHTLNWQQFSGLILVFTAVIVEVWINKKKGEESQGGESFQRLASQDNERIEEEEM